jgi:hypothetical protein
MKLPMIVVGVAWGAVTLLHTTSALAQAASPVSDVPDRFRLEVGGFRIGSDTELTFDTSGGSRPPVNFESLDVPENASRFYIEGFWRPGRRHQVSLSWYRNDREGDPNVVERDFNWGDQAVTVGMTVTARVDSSYLSGVYRFAAYKSDRFEIGPSVGIGYLSIETELGGDATLTGDQGSPSRPFNVSRGLNQPTGDLGGYLYWWPVRRLLVRGEARYILVKPEDAEAAVTEGRVATLYHVSRNIGVGLQYTYSKFRYDRDILSTEIGGSLRQSGGQLVLSAAF